MKDTRIIMGMPITIEVVDFLSSPDLLEKVFDYFKYIDEKFSPYKETSEISLINKRKLMPDKYSVDMKTVLTLSDKTKQETDGFFDIYYEGKYDPSGLVKGWSILKAAEILEKAGVRNYYVEAGGDIQVKGKNVQGEQWRIGIRNPFNIEQIIKVVTIGDKGIATSGTYLRGQHIYNPKEQNQKINEIVSLTVVGPNVYEADRFATAAFAMGQKGINFIKNLDGFEGYMVNKEGVAIKTGGFEDYEIN